MEASTVDLSALLVNSPLAVVVVFLFKELQRAHKENADRTNEHLQFLQKLVTRAEASDETGHS